MTSGACLACGSEEVVRFLRLDDMPVFCNVLWPTAGQARAAVRGTLDLGICGRCGHVLNLAHDPSLVTYGEGYENSLHHSPRFQSYAEALAAELRERHRLGGAHIVEVACGQGDFLRLLCSDEGSRGTGFDPSYRGEAVDSRVTIRPEPFSSAALTDEVDLLCCRHALEHMADPAVFLESVRETLGAGWQGTVFFEVPNSLYSLRDGGVWDFIYEHVSYFCGRSLTACFEHAGFKVERTWEAFSGQFLCVEARLEAITDRGRLTAEVPSSEEMVHLALGIRGRIDEFLERWRRRLRAHTGGSRPPVVIWGVGSKGVMFLNLLGDEAAACVPVDINPKKRNRFVACTGHQVVAPDDLRRLDPELIVLMNPVYLDEVADAARAAGVSAEIVGVDAP